MKKETTADKRIPPEEQRESRRLRVGYELSIGVSGGNMFYSGLIKDISTGGVFIATDRPHQVGDEVEVCFAFPGLSEPVRTMGTVRWCRSPFFEGALPEGIGVQLGDLPEEVVTAINRYLEKADVLIYDEDAEYSDW